MRVLYREPIEPQASSPIAPAANPSARTRVTTETDASTIAISSTLEVCS